VKRIVWIQGWMDLKTGEINLDLCAYHKKEDKEIFQKVLKEIKETWKKAFQNMKKIIQVEEKALKEKVSPEVRNDYRVYIKGKERIKKRKKTTQGGGYNE